MEKWEDITILNENVMAAHATFDYADTIDLNGIWDYSCIKGTDNLPQDLNSLGYGSMEVPSCVEPKGYSQAYYYGASFPPALNKRKIPSINHKDTHVSVYHRTFEKDDRTLEGSVWPYTLNDLFKASHIDELPAHSVSTLNINMTQNGLGDCFVRCPEYYKLKPNSIYQYSFYVSAI